MSTHCLHFQLNSVDKFAIRKVRSVVHVVDQRKTHVTQEKSQLGPQGQSSPKRIHVLI